MDVERIRADFPILSRVVNGKPLAYLDNASTTQKPLQVINAISEYYRNSNANVHRAIYSLGEEATRAYEQSRKKVAEFVNASNPKEIIFTRNATEAINLVRHGFALPGISRKPKIISTVMEHHSNFVPWQQLRGSGAEVVFMDVTDSGELKLEELEKQLEGGNTLLVAVTHASNTVGTINDVQKISSIAHSAGARCLVDAAQSAPHIKLDVRKLGCDFLAFSGHKMLAPTGIGVLYARREALEEMQPFLYGGDMISEVHLDRTEWNELPWKYEAGTPNAAGAVGLGAAIDYLNSVGLPEIEEHGRQLAKYLLEQLGALEGAEFYGPADVGKRVGLVSFNLAGIHPQDLASVLDSEGIAVRSGQNCTQPLIERLKVKQNAVARASFYLYNTLGEVERLVAGLQKAKKLFGV